jgi:hypothetical protein
MQDISTMRHLQAIRDRLSIFEQAHPEFATGEIPIQMDVEQAPSQL